MRAKIVMGSLSAEDSWVMEQNAHLPELLDKQTQRVVCGADEMQFVFCDAKDRLVCHYPIDSVYLDYINSLGYYPQIISLCSDTTYAGHQSLYEMLIATQQKYHNNLNGCALSPYAITKEISQLTRTFNLNAKSPCFSVVQKVNSKVYSTEIKQKLFQKDLTKAKIVLSAKDLTQFVQDLEQHKTILIKDAFGVAGKGTISISSREQLLRIKNYLEKQERAGKKICFVAEQLLPKKYDFSCNFNLSSQGDVKIKTVHQMINEGFSFNSIVNCNDSVKKIIETNNYFDTVSKIANELLLTGYFGPVCVDSMILEDDTLVPIVEINARKSMSLFKHAVDKKLNLTEKITRFTYISLQLTQEHNFFNLMRMLKEADLLYPNTINLGIIPLSSNAIFVNKELNEKNKSYRGRFYFSVVAKTEEQNSEYVNALLKCLQNGHIKIF